MEPLHPQLESYPINFRLIYLKTVYVDHVHKPNDPRIRLFVSINGMHI